MKDARMPTLTQLRLLAVVRRTESLGGAARELGVGQPTISERAKELERRCGVELFDRGLYTTYLTSDGQRFAKQAQRVLEEYDRLLSLIARKVRRQNLTRIAPPPPLGET
jgi:DNA-binding transcriptional LysR family regulator